MKAFAGTLILVGLGAFGLGVGSYWLYQEAAAFDAEGRLPTVKSRIMEGKADAMNTLLEGVLRGDLRRAQAAAKRLEQQSASIDFYLETTMYIEHGVAFHSALQALFLATEQNNWEAAKTAALDLERSCLECHAVLRSSGRD